MLSDGTINRCFRRMQCWLEMTESVLAAEFPSCDLLNSFEVFSTSCTRKSRATEVDSDADSFKKDCLEHLAKAYKVPFPNLLAQFDDHQPIAENIKRTTNCTTVEAWGNSIVRTEKRLATTTHPSRDLKPVVIEMKTYGVSSSGVEQGFAKALRNFSGQQESACPEREMDIIKVCVDVKPEEEVVVIRGAQQVWSKYYGTCRSSPKSARIDNGLTKPRTNNKTQGGITSSEAAWLRNRRASVNEAAASGTAVVRAERPRKLKDVHQKVIDFQRSKERKRMIEHHDAGRLMDHHVDDMEAFLRDVDEEHDRKRKRTTARNREDDARESKVPKINWLRNANLTGTTVHIDKDLVTVALRQVLAERAMLRVATRAEAMMFVVQSPADPGQRTKLAASLVGGVLLAPSSLDKNGGAAVAYHAALTMNKVIWTSAEFKSTHATLYAVMMDCHERFAKSNWRFEPNDDAASLNRLRKDCSAKNKRSVLIGIVTTAELKATSRFYLPSFSWVPNRFQVV